MPLFDVYVTVCRIHVVAVVAVCFFYCSTPSHKCLHALREIETTSFCLVILLSKSIHANRIFVAHTSILSNIPCSRSPFSPFALQIFSFRCTKFIISNLLPENKCDS